MDDMDVSDEDNPQPGTSSSPGGQSTNSETVISETECRGCDFQSKISIRGHLAKTPKGCIKLYSAKELKWLEEQAKSKQKKQTAQWKKQNKEAANEHEKKRYHKNANKLPERKVEFKCNICEKNFMTQYVLYRHLGEVHDSRDIQRWLTTCPQCPQSFSRKEILERHVSEVHESTASWKCDKCSLNFSRKENLDRHVSDVHENVESWKCDVCTQSFSRKESLLRHKSDVHENIVTSKCDQCSLSFSQKDNLVRHILEVHDKILGWECDKCPINLSRWENLKRHLDAVHAEGKCWDCDQCPQKFARLANLNIHKSVYHDKAEPFQCEVCLKHFTWKGNLNRHMSDVHHEVKRYKCDQCPENFSRFGNLMRHLDRESHTSEWECQFCHEKGLYYKSDNAARKHFLFQPRSSASKNRSEKVYSCVNEEKRRKEYARNESKHILEMYREVKEWDERRRRGELTPDEVKGIIESKEEYDNEYRPYDFDASFKDPISGSPMQYPVRSKCGHLFDKLKFIEHQKQYPHMSDWCPKKEHVWPPGSVPGQDFVGCLEKVQLSDLETDNEMAEEIERRKAKRKKEKETGSWPPGLHPYGQGGGGKAYSICYCNKCPKIYDSILHLNRHYHEEHKNVEMTPDKQEKKWCCSFCDPEPEFDNDYGLLKSHIVAHHPELKIIW